MDDMICPKCQGPMGSRQIGDAIVAKCSSCAGIFLERADVASLGEAENDWHRGNGPVTEPLPRITPDMTAPPRSRPAGPLVRRDFVRR